MTLCIVKAHAERENSLCCLHRTILLGFGYEGSSCKDLCVGCSVSNATVGGGLWKVTEL
jgi:hypothetical protein